MSIHNMRLVLGLLFLTLAAVIILRQWTMPGLAGELDPLRLNLGAVFALVFGGVNIARWYVVWMHRRERATPVRTPLQPDPSAVRPEPPNPELDFTKNQE